MEHNDHIKENILRKIRTGEVLVRPKVYFTLKMIALVLVALAVLLISIFIFNFILFSIRINSQGALLGFGPRGILAFLFFFPWKLLLIDIALVMLLENFLRRFSFGYRKPVLYLLLVLAALTVALGLFLDRGTPFNDQLYDRAERHELPPPFEGAYRGARVSQLQDGGICKCTVVSVDGSTLTVRDTANASSTYTIVLPPDMPMPPGFLSPGDTVFIAGDADGDDVIQAFGIRKLRDESR